MRKLFELQPANQNRIGPDAVDEAGRYFELKSTTRDRVSTARDVGLEHLKKWRERNWIFGRGYYEGNTFRFDQTYFLSPVQLEPWFGMIEAKLTKDDALFGRVLHVLDTNGFASEECDRVQRAFRRGVLLNDPKITWGYIRIHGTEICCNHSSALRKLLEDAN
ncbi:MAG: hypothetical protein LLG20_23895 [Acidobacteriales bacterium]|nr:hypothetical protein [Terriglobales bacterium]